MFNIYTSYMPHRHSFPLSVNQKPIQTVTHVFRLFSASTDTLTFCSVYSCTDCHLAIDVNVTILYESCVNGLILNSHSYWPVNCTLKTRNMTSYCCIPALCSSSSQKYISLYCSWLNNKKNYEFQLKLQRSFHLVELHSGYNLMVRSVSGSMNKKRE